MADEIIKEIVEVTDEQGGDRSWGRFDGFDVVTSEQRIQLRIQNGQDCCEQFGYFWMNEKPEEFIGAKVLGVEVVDTALNQKVLEAHDAHELDGGDVMFVNIQTDRGVLQFTAYNSHNGYYGHSALVRSRQVTKEYTL